VSSKEDEYPQSSEINGDGHELKARWQADCVWVISPPWRTRLRVSTTQYTTGCVPFRLQP
jgi:hypothetical protein